MEFNELKKHLISLGFRVDGDRFSIEVPDRNTVINGRHPVKKFEMIYIHEGVMYGSDSDEDVPVYEFDVCGSNGETVMTVCISTIDDLDMIGF